QWITRTSRLRFRKRRRCGLPFSGRRRTSGKGPIIRLTFNQQHKPLWAAERRQRVSNQVGITAPGKEQATAKGLVASIAVGPKDGFDNETLEQCELNRLCINTIRTLSMDAVQKANSGHPGTPMALAPLAFTLWNRYLRHNPRNPHWPGPRPLHSLQWARLHAALL